MRSVPILAVDCGASHVAVARLVHTRKGLPVWTGFGAEPVAVSSRDEDIWLQATATALQALGRRAGMRGACVLGVPGHLLQLHGVAIPRIAAGSRRRLLRFEAAQVMPPGADASAWSAVAVGEDAGREQVVITAVRVTALAVLCRSAVRAGFHPRAVFPSWWVALDATKARDGAPAAGVAVNIGARSTQVVVRSGTRCFVRNLGLGGDLIGRRLAEELGQTQSAIVARDGGIRTDVGSGPPDAPAAIATQLAAETLARRLAGEIGRLVDSVGTGDSDPRPVSVQVGGGGALAPGLSRTLAELLALSPISPSASASVPPGIDRDDARSPLDLSHAADAAALGACASRRDARYADLLPRRMRRELRLGRWWPLAAAAAIVLAAGLWWPIGRFWSQSRRLHREAAVLSGQSGAIRARAAVEQATKARLRDITRRAAALQGLVTARAVWPAFLADLEARLARTGDVWLERLELEMSPDRPGAATKAASGRRPPNRTKAARARPLPPAGLRLRLSGCIFDADHPLVAAGEGGRERVKTLWANLAASPYVAELADEHLEAERAGILRFEVTLVVESQALL